MPPLYPLHVNIGGRLCVIVGGGTVAERKVGALLEAHARVRVVSPEFTPRLTQIAISGHIETICTPYAPEHLNGALLAFAVTNNSAVNAQVIADAQARGILCNSADAPETADFVTTGTVRRGELLLSVSAGGNPTLTAQIVAELESYYGVEYAEFVQLMTQIRDSIKTTISAPDARKIALKRLAQARSELLELLRNGDADAAQRCAAEIVEGDRTLASDSGRIEPPQRTD
jgi:precorrin-2 dehydrogenase / sirohydrochlorin ferrochelatase